MEDVQAVTGTMWNLLAVKTDHTLWTIPPSGSMSPPEKRMEEVAFASASSFHTLAIKTDGSLWSWGYNDCGQLGDGTRDAEAGTVHEPQKILEHVRFAAASDTRSFAILEDHSLWYWGREWMGDGDVCILTPAKLMEDVRFVAPSYDGILVITDDGTLCGLGRLHWSDESLTFPELTPLLEEVVYCDTSLAVTEDGGLWIWGFLLEQYSMKESLARPVRIMDHVSFAAIGVNHIFAVTDTGALYQIEFNPPEGELEEYHPALVDTGIMRYSLDIQIDGLPSAPNGDKRVLFAGVIVLAVCGTVFLLSIKKHKHQ